MEEDGCDKGAHKSYLVRERSVPVVTTWPTQGVVTTLVSFQGAFAFCRRVIEEEI